MKHKNIYRDMCNRYGAHLPARFKKLFEECNELQDAFIKFSEDPNPSNAAALFDEVGDVAIILTHICYVVGLPIDELIKTTHNKIKERDAHPGFKHSKK